MFVVTACISLQIFKFFETFLAYHCAVLRIEKYFKLKNPRTNSAKHNYVTSFNKIYGLNLTRLFMINVRSSEKPNN